MYLDLVLNYTLIFIHNKKKQSLATTSSTLRPPIGPARDKTRPRDKTNDSK